MIEHKVSLESATPPSLDVAIFVVAAKTKHPVVSSLPGFDVHFIHFGSRLGFLGEKDSKVDVF